MSEKSKLVNRVDDWSQEHDIEVDHQFESIFQNAKGKGYGWSQIEEEDPTAFEKAYDLAIKHKDEMLNS